MELFSCPVLGVIINKRSFEPFIYVFRSCFRTLAVILVPDLCSIIIYSLPTPPLYLPWISFSSRLEGKGERGGEREERERERERERELGRNRDKEMERENGERENATKLIAILALQDMTAVLHVQLVIASRFRGAGCSLCVIKDSGLSLVTKIPLFFFVL